MHDHAAWWQPHGHCFLWDPHILWPLTTCGVLIFLFYIATSATLWVHLRQAPLATRVGSALAAIFATCGIDRMVEVATLYRPWYWALVTSKTATALISGCGLYVLVRWALSRQVRQSLRLIELSATAQAFVDSLPFPAFLCTPDGGDEAVNSGYVEVVGLDIDAVRGYLWERLIHPEERDAVVRWWRDYCAGRTDKDRMRFRFNHPDEGFKWIRVTGHHLPDGRHWGKVEDISERVAIEEESRALSALRDRI